MLPPVPGELFDALPEDPGPHLAGLPAGPAAILGGELIAAISAPPIRESGDSQRQSESCADQALPGQHPVWFSARR